MFNKIPFRIKNFVMLLLLIAIVSCAKEQTVQFTEQLIAPKDGAEINILYPKAEGGKTIEKAINGAIENHMVNALSFSEEPLKEVSLMDAIANFNLEYKRFKDEFPDSVQRWNAAIEGEVSYQSPKVITVAMNTYLDTGGAHGNDIITFLNFNPKTGTLLKNKDLLEHNTDLIALAKTYMVKAINQDKGSIDDYFYGEPFHLPENIGFNEDGVVLLYNVYEIASYAQGYTEFVIPFNEIEPFLKVE